MHSCFSFLVEFLFISDIWISFNSSLCSFKLSSIDCILMIFWFFELLRIEFEFDCKILKAGVICIDSLLWYNPSDWAWDRDWFSCYGAAIFYCSMISKAMVLVAFYFKIFYSSFPFFLFPFFSFYTLILGYWLSSFIIFNFCSIKLFELWRMFIFFLFELS